LRVNSEAETVSGVSERDQPELIELLKERVPPLLV
jgi:hypothetical protein